VQVVSCVSDLVEISWVTAGDNNSPIIEYVVYYTNTSEDEQPGPLVEGPHLSVEDEVRHIPTDDYFTTVKR